MSDVFVLENLSMASNDLLISFGVNNEKIWAIIVMKIPSRNRYLYLTKYLFRYCNSFIFRRKFYVFKTKNQNRFQIKFSSQIYVFKRKFLFKKY